MRVRINGKNIINKIQDDQVFQMVKPELKIVSYSFLITALSIVLSPTFPVFFQIMSISSQVIFFYAILSMINKSAKNIIKSMKN
jgi:hypothetical protein